MIVWLICVAVPLGTYCLGEDPSESQFRMATQEKCLQIVNSDDPGKYLKAFGNVWCKSITVE